MEAIYLHHLVRLRIDSGRIGRFTQRLGFPIGRFIRFGLVGFSGVFVDLTVFYLLRTVLGFGLTRSTIISAEVAIFNNFLWNDLWTFGDVSQQQQQGRMRLKRLLKFNIICLAGVVLQALIVNLLFNVLGINEYLAKLMAIAAVTLWNFWINMKLSWRVTQVK